jgi:hypothetical protein
MSRGRTHAPSRGPSHGDRRGAALRAAAVLLAGLLIAACGPEQNQPSTGPTAVPIETPTVTQYQLGATVWYAGLVIHVTSATAAFDPTGGTVSIATRFDNPGADDAAPDFPIRITAGGSGYDPVHGTQLPLVPAGGSADALLSFDVAGRGSVEGAVLRIGRSEANQALVPFGAGPVALKTLQPVELQLGGKAVAADLQLVLRTGELRWDLPDWSDEEPVNVAALHLDYDVVYKGSAPGGLAFTGDNVTLVLPDGSSVSPRADGRSQSIVQLAPNVAQVDLDSRFDIPSNQPGTYTLVLHNGAAKGTVTFTIPG